MALNLIGMVVLDAIFIASICFNLRRDKLARDVRRAELAVLVDVERNAVRAAFDMRRASDALTDALRAAKEAISQFDDEHDAPPITKPSAQVLRFPQRRDDAS